MIQVFKNMRRAQVAIYLLMTIVAITLLALLNVDVYSLVRGKMRVENAGDAAAIAAAEGTSTDSFVVRSIRRRPSNKW